jgi:proteic killer suppression protein
VIRSFACKETARIFRRERSRRFPAEIQQRALERLIAIHAAINIADLRMPPGNRLEALHGDRRGSWSLRINDQWRVCFRYEGGDALDVEIVDYHH